MKKNIPQLLMPLLFFIAADATAQEWCADETNFLQNSAIAGNKSTFQVGHIVASSMAADSRAKEQSAKDSRCPVGMNFYAKIFGGANFLQNTTIDGNKFSYQPGYIFAGSLGYCWRDYGLRVEAEYAFRRNAISKIHFITQGSSENGHFQNSSCMANLLWDFPLCSWGCAFWKLQPFIGAGIGYDFQKVHSSNSRIDFHQKWNHFSWQMMTGLSYPIFHNAEITLEYQFHQGNRHFNNHAIGVGLVYKFGFIR
jgi:opacity protein-like surface antigen